MRERAGYFSWTNPNDGIEYGLGRDRRDAITQVLEARMKQAGAQRARLADRIDGEESRTWSKWCDEFEKILAGRKRSHNTELGHRTKLKRMRTLVDKNKPAHAVDTLDVSKAIDALTDAGKHRMAQAFRSFLIDGFDRMIAKGWRKDNPAEVTDAVSVEVKRARLSLSVFKRLYETTSIDWLRNAMALAIVSGQARENCQDAKFADFHDGGWWNERGKTGARIFLPLELRLNCVDMSLADVFKQCRTTGVLSKHLIHHVKAAPNADPGKPVHIETITRAFTAELAKLGIDWGKKEPPTFHEIRSLSGRLYKDQGDVNPTELYGHRDPATTSIYLDGRGEWVKVGIRKSTV